MNKIIVLIFVPLLLLSCSKKTSELEISETTQAVDENIVDTAQIESNSTKQLKTIGINDTLEIYARGDGAPGMYVDENGELKGFYIDLEKAIMKEMGQKYHLNSYLDAGTTVQMIRDGVAHSALSVPDLPDYRSFLNLSITYEDLNFVTIVQKTNSDINATSREELLKQLSGKRVGVQTRGHIYQALREYKEIIIVEYPTTTQAMDALNRGEIDAVPDVKRIMEHYSKINNWSLKAVGEPIISQKIATGFSQAIDTTVVERYNVALKKLIDSGYVNKLYNSYFNK